MLADLHFDHVDAVVVAHLAGDVDMSNAGDIGAALTRTVTNDKLALVLDVSAVDYFDSAGIHLVYDLRERLRMRGVDLRLVVPADSKVRSTLELAAVLQTMEVEATVDAALAAVVRDAR